MMIKIVLTGYNQAAARRSFGQSMVEFALLLPLFVLVVVGIFDLGRAFFAFIAISNGAREGARIYTFQPEITDLSDVTFAITREIGTSPGFIPVDILKITSIDLQCGSAYSPITSDAELEACPGQQPFRVTVTYTQDLILGFFFSQPLTLVRSAEMMVPWKN